MTSSPPTESQTLSPHEEDGLNSSLVLEKEKSKRSARRIMPRGKAIGGILLSSNMLSRCRNSKRLWDVSSSHLGDIILS
jgi:hypothetical protein